MKTIPRWQIWVVVSAIAAGLSWSVPAYGDETDLAGSGVSVGPVVEVQALSQVLGSFIDTDDPTATAGSFNATINWGDGTTSTGTITANPSGGFFVSGTHTYGDELTNNVASITITSVGETGSITFTDGFNVVEAETLTGTTFTATVGTPFIGQVSSFTDVNSANTASDFSVVINWGDGTASAGIVSGGAGVFDISGTHTYAGPWQFPVTSTLQLDGFGDDSVTSTANVAGSTSAPEPSSAVLLCAGLCLLTLMTRQRSQIPNLKLRVPDAS